MLRRNLNSDFVGGAYVFPGGAVDPEDRHLNLEPVCEGRSDVDASRRLGIESGGLAFWVAAIRESFEEAGVLLAYDLDGMVDLDDARSAARWGHHRAQVQLRRGMDLLDMHVKDFQPPAPIGPIHQDLAIETSGAQQSRIENLRPVRRRQHDDADAWVEPVHLGQKLVQRLLLFIVSASGCVDAPGPAQRIKLVDEYDRRRQLAGLLEQVAHPRGADAHEHFDELRSGYRQERDIGFTRNRPGQ